MMIQWETAMAQTSNPSFSIYRADGSKVPTLRRSFIIKQDITQAELDANVVSLDDGTSWELVVDDEVWDRIKQQGSAYCIVSYQAHSHGNYAVARLFKVKGKHND